MLGGVKHGPFSKIFLNHVEPKEIAHPATGFSEAGDEERMLIGAKSAPASFGRRSST
jgi:hypothetical protein